MALGTVALRSGICWVGLLDRTSVRLLVLPGSMGWSMVRS
jgi:hypothetical protein